ncbi:MAG TPA: hypothetical protein VJJ22_04460 [Candidatus Paceibacterota bacterium]
MTKEEIITKVKGLNMPRGSYVVFGSGPLVVAGIRLAQDIDLYVTKEVQKQKLKEGWQFVNKGGKDIPLTHDVFEMHTNWDFSSYNPSLADLLSTAAIVDGVAFASLDEVRKWKVVSARPKDLADIILIDGYFKS